MIGIYCIRYKTTGKCYVGQSVDIKQRTRKHRTLLTNCTAIRHAIAKYGAEAFAFEVLELCTEPELNDRECHWIDTLNSLMPNGYNLKTGGESGGRYTEEAKQAISDGLKGNVPWNKGKKGLYKASKETREKMSKAHKGHNYYKGYKPTEETKRKISEAMKGNKYALGLKHTEESRRKMSIAVRRAKQKKKHHPAQIPLLPEK